MSELIPSPNAGRADAPGTALGRFMATRGVLLLKEFRKIETLPTEFHHKIAIESWMIATAKGKNATRQFGIRFEHHDEDGRPVGSKFLDFDEIDEFVEAIAYIGKLAKKIAGQPRDHTEVVYSTKDDVRVGFYQTKRGGQDAFFGLGNSGLVALMSLDRLESLRQVVESAKGHLISRGAESDERSDEGT